MAKLSERRWERIIDDLLRLRSTSPEVVDVALTLACLIRRAGFAAPTAASMRNGQVTLAWQGFSACVTGPAAVRMSSRFRSIFQARKPESKL